MARKKNSTAEKQGRSEFESKIVNFGDKGSVPAHALGFRPGKVLASLAAPPMRDIRNLKLDGEELLKLPKVVELDSTESKILDVAAPFLQALSELQIDDDELVEELKGFFEAYLDRADKANPPAVPERKFTPRKDQIVPFIREVWSEWIERRLLTKRILKDYDDKAYDALMNFQRNNELPDDLHLDTQKEANDLFLKRRYFTADEVHRVVGLLSRRGKDSEGKR